MVVARSLDKSERSDQAQGVNQCDYVMTDEQPRSIRVVLNSAQ